MIKGPLQYLFCVCASSNSASGQGLHSSLHGEQLGKGHLQQSFDCLAPRFRSMVASCVLAEYVPWESC